MKTHLLTYDIILLGAQYLIKLESNITNECVDCTGKNTGCTCLGLHMFNLA